MVPNPNPTSAPERDDDREDRLAALLEAARAGKPDSLDEIVAELTPLLWHVVRAQGLSRELAQDVVQTTWLRLLNDLHAIRTPRALTGWLVTVAKREAWQVGRLHRADLPLDEHVALNNPDDSPLPDAQVLADERQRILWSLIGRLERRCQQLLRILAFAPDTSYTAVAAALGMPVGSIGPTRGRCLAKLRALIAAEPAWSWR
jgi:RNA polymerase sigma factor (sigma-70 family)